MSLFWNTDKHFLQKKFPRLDVFFVFGHYSLKEHFVVSYSTYVKFS